MANVRLIRFSSYLSIHPLLFDRLAKEPQLEIFKLEIENIFLIDWFGGPKPITPSEYLDYGK
jgi:hypothetical protein